MMGNWMHFTRPSVIIVIIFIVMLSVLAILDRYKRSYPRKGFLPYSTTRGDRIFLSLLIMIGIGLVWLKFLTIQHHIPIWGAFIVSIIITIAVIWKG